MRYIKAIYIGLIGMLLAGCQADQWESIEGGFQITLSDEVTVTTKSTPAELGEPTTDKFKLKIVNEATNNAAYDGAYKSGTIPAAAGTYTITASFGENPVLALDDPYYKGEETGVVVKDGETTSVNISCTVANALATIFYADTAKFDEMYSSYGVEIKVNNYSVTIGDGTKESAYYQVGSKPTFTFKGVLKGNNKEVSKVLENDLLSSASTFEAGQHCKLTLSMEATASGLVPTISKAEATTVTINETIPMEWLPKPKVTGFDAEGTKEITYTETADAVSAAISFSGAMPIEDWEMTLEFADPVYNSLNKKYTFSTLTDEDRTSLTQAGIVLPSLDEAKDGKIDFTGLTAKLQVASDDETSNTIRLRVKANNRWSSEEGEEDAFTIKTIAPEIVPTAKPEDIWTKTLTVSGCEVNTGKLDPSTIQKYQYLDGSEWKYCVDGLAALSDIPEDNQMQVRAMYREGVYAKPVTIELEKPEQLPNSGMEEWNVENYTKSLYCFYPWQDKNECHWDTNNLYTTRHRHNSSDAVIANYNGFHAVSYVSGHNGIGLAAELRSTANGRGNTDDFLWVDHEEKDHNKVAGELFLGDCKLNITGNDINGDDSYEREKNATFTNRPTALKFWYKYAPYNSDTWSAHIELLDEAKNIIIQQDLTSSEAKNDWTEATVSLDYDEGTVYKKCKYIYVIFRSTVNSGANMPYREITQTFYVDGQVKTFSPAYVGSVLTIDDISLVYDK